MQVLLVEDNPGDARLIQEALQDAGPNPFEVDTTPRLSDALEALARAPYDVVLLDLSLPDSHGIETVAHVVAEAPRTPVVVLTGLQDETVALETLKEGAEDYVVKGEFSPQLLGRTLRYAVERRQAAMELQALRRQVALSEKLATLGALVSGVSRDIRAATTPLEATLQALHRKARAAQTNATARETLPSEVEAHAGEARAGLERLHIAMEALERNYRAGPRARAEASLGELVAVALDLFQTTKPPHVRLDADLQPTLPVPVNAAQVQHVVLALLENAAEAQPQGGAIHVATRSVADGGEIVVTDQGPGIPMATLPRILEPFFTTQPGAAGLGLPVAQRIVAAHGGAILCDTEEGGGATFIVRLPAAATAPGAVSDAAAGPE